DQNVQSMVDIVIPLRVVALNLAALRSLKITGLVVVVFQNKVDVSIRLHRASHCISKFPKDVRSGIVDDSVNRVQPESVELILDQPIQRVLDEEVTDDSALSPVE